MKAELKIGFVLLGLASALVGCQTSSETPAKPALTQAEFDKMTPAAQEGYKKGMAAQNAARARLNQPALPVLGGNGP